MSRYIDADAFKRNNADLLHCDFPYLCEDTLEEIIDDEPTADVVEVVRCKDCIHAKQHSYAPAECQWYCTLSLQYHGGRFFCACGERGTDLLEWLHRGDDDEQGV